MKQDINNKPSAIVTEILNGHSEDDEDIETILPILDSATFHVKNAGKQTEPLTIKEAGLFNELRDGVPKTRAELTNKIWPKESLSRKSLDVHMYKLRAKLIDIDLEIAHLSGLYFLVDSKTKESILTHLS